MEEMISPETSATFILWTLVTLSIHAVLSSASISSSSSLDLGTSSAFASRMTTTDLLPGDDEEKDDPDRVLSRHRRFFIPSLKGWALEADFYLYLPLTEISTVGYILLPFVYNIDTGLVTRKRRSTFYEESRFDTLQKIESYISAFVDDIHDVHACVLRTLCEMAETPTHDDGLLGHLLNALLMPAHHLSPKPPATGESDYVAAQRNGQMGKGCSMYWKSCPVSFFQIDDLHQLDEELDDTYTSKNNMTSFLDLDNEIANALPMSSLNDDPDRVLSRQRRFFFPASTGWSVEFDFYVYVPLPTVGTTGYLYIPFTYSFDTGKISGRKRRSDSFEKSRHSTLHKIESFLFSFLEANLDIHACALRAICEASETPAHSDGLIGHLVNALLMPAHFLKAMPVKGEVDYVAAQRQGQLRRDCSPYWSSCSVTMFKIDELDQLHDEYLDRNHMYTNRSIYNQA